MVYAMVMVNKNGLTGANTLVNGAMVLPVGMANFTMLMVTSMMECGNKIKQTDMEPTSMQMVLSTQVSGKMTNSMAMVMRHGQMELSTRASTSRVKNTAEAN